MGCKNNHNYLFHCRNGRCGRDVDADYNTARNVLKRYVNPDIGLFTPYKEVKVILEGRLPLLPASRGLRSG